VLTGQCRLLAWSDDAPRGGDAGSGDLLRRHPSGTDPPALMPGQTQTIATERAAATSLGKPSPVQSARRRFARGGRRPVPGHAGGLGVVPPTCPIEGHGAVLSGPPWSM
jgi:hypothetical protein